MRFQVSRTDTGQFVLIDPATETVVVDDDLDAGFARFERILAENPPPTEGQPASSDGGSAEVGGSPLFGPTAGRRYTPVLLAVVLPFAWLAVFYVALANLLSAHTLSRDATEQTRARVEALEREVQKLRAELAGSPDGER